MKRPISDVVPLEESSSSRPRREAPLSAKVRDKLEELAEWRVDASQLTIVTDGPRVEGGFAVVCRASLIRESPKSAIAAADALTQAELDPQGEVDVAVKRMKIKDGDDVYQVLKRAVREADIIADLNHENIITLEGFVEDLANGKVWLIFPWAEMGNVRDFVASRDWSIPERIWLIYDVAHGVEHLHSQNPPICHGDLKSINILINSECRAIIADFGSARRLRNVHDAQKHKPRPVRPTPDDTTLSAEFCQSSNIMTFTGTKYTLRWVAPEVLEEEDVGTAADIWSMGWVFYEIMTGSIPFESLQKDTAIIRHIMKGEFPSLKDHDRMSPILPLVSLMMTCWEITPERRPLAERCRKYVSQMPMCPPCSRQSPTTALETARRLYNEGIMYTDQNDYDKALTVFTEALQDLDDQAMSIKAAILWGIAEVLRLRNDTGEAATLYAEAAQIFDEIGDRGGKAHAQHGLAEVHRALDEYDMAAALYDEAVQICDEIGDRGGKSAAQWGLAEVHRLRHEYDEAATLYTDVVQICEELGNQRGKADGQSGLADVHQARGEYDEAAALYTVVAQTCDRIGDRSGKADAYCGLAKGHRARKEYAESSQLFMESSQLCRACGDKRGLAYSLRGLADVSADQDCFKDATRFYEEAADLFAEIGYAEDASDAFESATDSRRKDVELPKTD